MSDLVYISTAAEIYQSYQGQIDSAQNRLMMMTTTMMTISIFKTGFCLGMERVDKDWLCRYKMTFQDCMELPEKEGQSNIAKRRGDGELITELSTIAFALFEIHMTF